MQNQHTLVLNVTKKLDEKNKSKEEEQRKKEKRIKRIKRKNGEKG